MNEKDIFLAGNGHAVILIHGLGGSPLEMKSIAKRLHKNGMTVHIPLLAGHSGSIEDLKKVTWEDWLRSLLDSYEFLEKRSETVSACGLCLGANLALLLASRTDNKLLAISLLSTTIYFDGWNLPWYKFLMPLTHYPPLSLFYEYEEKFPYGIKNDEIREKFQRAKGMQKDSSGTPRLPSKCLHEQFKAIKATKKETGNVTVPTLLIHALEDDTSSIKSVDYVEKHIRSQVVKKIFLEDTYHNITVDNQREIVIDQTTEFFKEHQEKSTLQPVSGLL